LLGAPAWAVIGVHARRSKRGAAYSDLTEVVSLIGAKIVLLLRDCEGKEVVNCHFQDQ